MGMEDYIRKRAYQQVKKKKGFYSHLAVFISVGIFFFLINILSMNNGDTELWFFFPLLPWSIGLLIHYFSVFGLPGTNILTKDWEDAELEKEMQKLRRKMRYYSEEEAEEKLDLKEMEREPAGKKRNWDDNEIV